MYDNDVEAVHSFTSSDSDRNSCMMSLSPITRMEQTEEGNTTQN